MYLKDKGVIVTNPENWKNLLTNTYIYQHAFAVVIAVFAGIVAHVEKIQKGTIKGFSFITLVYDVTISAFVGILTLYFCLKMDFDMNTTGLTVGVISHQGTRGLALLTNKVTELLTLKKEDKDKKE